MKTWPAEPGESVLTRYRDMGETVYTLGVNLSRHHSACLLKDGGSPIATVEAWLAGQSDDDAPAAFGRRHVTMPERSIEYCLSNAGISYVDLDVIVFCDAALPAPRALRKLSIADCVLRLPFSPQSRMLTMDPALARAYSVYYLSGYVVDDGTSLGAALYGWHYEQSPNQHHR